MVKTPHSDVGWEGASMPQRSHMPPVGKNKTLNRNNIVTNSINTLSHKKRNENLFRKITSAQARGWEKAVEW